MEHYDPLQRRQIVLGVLAIVIADRGDTEEALARWLAMRAMGCTVAGRRCSPTRHTPGAPSSTRAPAGWAGGGGARARSGQASGAERAFLHDRAGAGGGRVAARRRGGDARSRGAHARRWWRAGRSCSATGVRSISCLPWARSASSIAPAKCSPTRSCSSTSTIRTSLAAITRGRLLGLRGGSRHLDGESERADADLLAMWEDRGRVAALRPATGLGGASACRSGARSSGAPSHPRRHWPRSPRRIPDGLELTPFLDHPVAAVSDAGAGPRPRCGGAIRRALERGCRRGGDRRPRAAARELVAAAPLRAARAASTCGGAPGGAGEGAGERPVDARLIRFLLVNLGRPVLGGRDLRGALGRPLRLERPAQPPGGGVARAPGTRSARGRTQPDRECRSRLPAGPRRARHVDTEEFDSTRSGARTGAQRRGAARGRSSAHARCGAASRCSRSATRTGRRPPGGADGPLHRGADRLGRAARRSGDHAGAAEPRASSCGSTR